VQDWDLVQVGKNETARKAPQPFPAQRVTAITPGKVYGELPIRSRHANG
jgi:hypothetical protein